MATTDAMSSADVEFLARCEEELKDRYTEKDEEFMKVFTAEPSKPPIVESWWVPQGSGRRNDRRNNRRVHHYERPANRRDNDSRDNYDRRGYNDYNRGYNDSNRGYNDYNHGYEGRRQGYQRRY